MFLCLHRKKDREKRLLTARAAILLLPLKNPDSINGTPMRHDERKEWGSTSFIVVVPIERENTN